MRSLLGLHAVRRSWSTLFCVALSACAHEPNRPGAGAPAAAHRTRAPSSAAASLPTTEPEPLELADVQLATEYATAPAISKLEGEASYYSDRLAGHKTASGERYRPAALTAAHRTLPLGTVLRVTRTDGKRAVFVRINDRGPFGSRHRILDLSRAAFERLGKLRSGVLDVRAEVVAYGRPREH